MLERAERVDQPARARVLEVADTREAVALLQLADHLDGCRPGRIHATRAPPGDSQQQRRSGHKLAEEWVRKRVVRSHVARQVRRVIAAGLGQCLSATQHTKRAIDVLNVAWHLNAGQTSAVGGHASLAQPEEQGSRRAWPYEVFIHHESGLWEGPLLLCCLKPYFYV